MKISKVKINSYGKLNNEEIDFNDGINIIYGKNESGKSTLLRFIENCFYGISKNKKGKEFSDYDSYLPWKGEEFSGKIDYELDNGEKFEVFRDFKKKNPKIFNSEKEDISKDFNIDKSKGNEFFYEQTNMDEDLFLSTIVSYQQRVRLEKGEQNFLIQKIANLVGTGDDNVSYRIAKPLPPLRSVLAGGHPTVPGVLCPKKGSRNNVPTRQNAGITGRSVPSAGAGTRLLSGESCRQ